MNRLPRTRLELEQFAIVAASGLLAGLIVAALLLLAGMVDLGAQVVVDPRVTGVPRACGVLHTNTTQAATIADTNETNLWTFTLPANSLNRDGVGLRITTGGVLGATANNKTLKLYFGASQIASLSTTANASGWRMGGIVLRTGAATQRANGDIFIGLGVLNITQSAPAETLSGTVLIRMTGQNAVAAAGDIVYNEAVVECL